MKISFSDIGEVASNLYVARKLLNVLDEMAFQSNKPDVLQYKTQYEKLLSLIQAILLILDAAETACNDIEKAMMTGGSAE